MGKSVFWFGVVALSLCYEEKKEPFLRLGFFPFMREEETEFAKMETSDDFFLLLLWACRHRQNLKGN